jgi:hypothetical protein
MTASFAVVGDFGAVAEFARRADGDEAGERALARLALLRRQGRAEAAGDGSSCGSAGSRRSARPGRNSAAPMCS